MFKRITMIIITKFNEKQLSLSEPINEFQPSDGN